METFLNYLSANPIVANILLGVLVILLFSLILMYAIAFAQGREISFWPPKIGPKPNGLEQTDRTKTASSTVENPVLAAASPTANAGEKPHGKSPHVTSNHKITEEEIVSLIKQHNEDFSRVLESRDHRYLKATTSEKGEAQVRQSVINLLDYMQENGIKITHLIEMRLLNWRLIAENKVRATTDEIWEESYLDGHTTQLVDRNVYEIAFVDGLWLIDACEVLPPVEKDSTDQKQKP